MNENINCEEYPNNNAKLMLERTITEMGFENFKVTLTLASNKGDNYLGVIHRVSVSGKKNDDAESQINLILKTAPAYQRDKFPLQIFYEREIYSYRTILKTLDDFQAEYRVPDKERFHFVKVYTMDIKELEELLIMEDLKELGFVMADRKVTLTLDETKLVLKHLAYFHALSFKLKQVNSEEFDKMAGSIHQGIELNDLFEKFIDISLNRAEDNLIDEHDKKKLKRFRKNSVYSVFKKCYMGEGLKPYTVFCHGDSWTNNILFKYENGQPVDICMVDWQMIKETSPILDIFYFIFSSTDQKVREDFNALFDYYYDKLKYRLSQLDCDVEVSFPRNIFEKHIKIYLPYGMVQGCMTAPMFVSEEEDILDLNEILKTDDLESVNMELTNEKSKKKYEHRVRGIVNDTVRLGGI